jgi:hypothetical protein
MSTKLQHKRIHKGNYIAPVRHTFNQIGHVIVNNHGLNCDSYHFLIKIIKQKVIIQQLDENQQLKWNRINL